VAARASPTGALSRPAHRRRAGAGNQSSRSAVRLYDAGLHNRSRNRARNWVHSRIWRSRDYFLSTPPTRKTARLAHREITPSGPPRVLARAYAYHSHELPPVARIQERARSRAADLAPTIAELQAGGCESLRAIAAGLEERGIPAARGGKWSAVQVARLLEAAAVPFGVSAVTAVA
jgi:hypothetical protein